MRIPVRVIPKASKVKIEPFNQGLKIRLNSPATGGRANKELIEVLSRYYNIKKYHITIIKGKTQRDKIVQLSEAD